MFRLRFTWVLCGTLWHTMYRDNEAAKIQSVPENQHQDDGVLGDDVITVTAIELRFFHRPQTILSNSPVPVDCDVFVKVDARGSRLTQ